MAMDGSDSRGDGDTLPQYFGPDFNEYINRISMISGFSGANKTTRSNRLSLDNCADFNLNVCAIPKVRDNIRRALQKLMQSHPWFYGRLVQFWAATKTLEGRTLLTTRYEPFALGGAFDPSYRVPLCNYWIEMCREYNNCFYADAESGEEQLGLPGRVFLHQFPESILKVEYYTTKEYPQRDLALRCNIMGSWAVPVFEHSSRTCVGVLEIVSLRDSYWYGVNEIFLDNVNKIFQEVGLQCFIGDQACMRRVNAYQAREDEELRTALRSVCQIHKLPLAMIWVPCAHNGLRLLEVEFCSRRIGFRGSFLKASKLSHLRKGLVFRRALSSADMLYCSNISKLSIVEYPLVSYARLCKFSGWFTICLQNVYTGNDIYVLEFFLSPRSKDNENILTTLSSILGTIEEKFTTFRFASGKELGELIRVEDIQFQENQKIHSLQSIQATRDFSMSSIPSSVQSSASVANIWPGSQDACMGTINAKYDSDSNPSSDSDHSVEQSTTSVPMVTVKAKYASYTTKFKLSSPYRFVELQQKVTEWLNLPVGTYHVSYEDESGELILIACDEDLHACVETPLSLGNTSTVVFLEPK